MNLAVLGNFRKVALYIGYYLGMRSNIHAAGSYTVVECMDSGSRWRCFFRSKTFLFKKEGNDPCL